jgi:hypothetical protein
MLTHSEYLHGLLTSGLAESVSQSDELTMPNETDGRAMECIVDLMYSGQLSLSVSTVSFAIRTANVLGVTAAEKAACKFLVQGNYM